MNTPLLRWIALLGLVACTDPPPPAPPVPAPTAQVCVARHAESFRNLNPRPEGLSEAELDALTPQGEAQARALAARLPAGVARVWSSPLNRAQQTAGLLGAPVPVEVQADLRPLDGAIPWAEREAAWAAGQDPRPPDGESLGDGQGRAVALLGRLRDQLGPGQHAVLVTHSDLGALLLGELRGTPLLERPAKDTLATGDLACLPLGP